MKMRKTVGVMGSGSLDTVEAQAVGEMLARLGCNLLSGGGAGQMRAVAKAYVAVPDRAGQSIGVIPSRPDDPTRTKNPGYPNPFVEIPIRTHLGGTGTDPTSRNHINILSSDVLVFLYGSAGTQSEAKLAKAYGKARRLFVLPETREKFECTELLGLFRDDEVLATAEALEDWLKSKLS